MAKIFLATVLVVALSGVVKIGAEEDLRQATGNYGQDALKDATNFVQDMPSKMEKGMKELGDGMQSGPLETLSKLPEKGMEMLDDVVDGIKDAFNNFGRSDSMSQQKPNQFMQDLNTNSLNDMAKGMFGPNGNNNGMKMPDFNQMYNQMRGGPQQQGGFPDMSKMFGGGSGSGSGNGNGNGFQDFTKNLMNSQDGQMRLPNNLGSTFNNAAQQAQGGFDSMMNNLRQ